MLNAIAPTNNFKHTLGMKQFELTNHLGNVLAVVTDRKHPRDDDGNGFIDYYQPEIVKATDYSPFGVELYDRNYVREEVTVISTEQIETIIDQDNFSLTTNGGTYNVGDQGNGWTHLIGTGNVTANEDYFINSNPFIFGNWIIAQKDWSGLLNIGDDYRITFDIVTINGVVLMAGPQGITNTYSTTGTKTLDFTATTTNGSFQLWSIFGGVPTDVTIDNIKLVKIETVTETCTVPVGLYKYGFNGMEKDDEVKGKGNSVNYTYRMHDTRLGRFFAVDPVTAEYPELTPYQHSSLNPIWMFELEGLEGIPNIVAGTLKWTIPHKYNMKKVTQKFELTVGLKSQIPLSSESFLSKNQTSLSFEGSVTFKLSNKSPYLIASSTGTKTSFNTNYVQNGTTIGSSSFQLTSFFNAGEEATFGVSLTSKSASVSSQQSLKFSVPGSLKALKANEPNTILSRTMGKKGFKSPVFDKVTEPQESIKITVPKPASEYKSPHESSSTQGDAQPIMPVKVNSSRGGSGMGQLHFDEIESDN